MNAAMRLDWIGKLQHLLQTAAFCLVIATVQYAFEPDHPWGPPVAYSLAIGLSIWAIIDLGREALPSARETGWPPGAQGLVLAVVGIVGGYFAGNAIGDVLCRMFGLYTPGLVIDRAKDLRNSVLITAMAGIVGTYYFYSRNRGAYLERRMSEAQRHANEARLKLLETQLEPHMLFNTLANLQGLIAIDPERAQHMLDQLIQFLRATLTASRAATTTLAQEFALTDAYLGLMAVRMGARLGYTLDLPRELADAAVPPMLLQPLVENAIAHGLEPTLEGGHIAVTARRDGECIVLTVADNGRGPDAPSGKPGTSLGLSNTRERLAALFGARAGVTLAAAPAGGAIATITLPA